MAEETDIEELIDKEASFKDRFIEAFNMFQEYFACPQLTCGQFTNAEVRDVFNRDIASVGNVRPTDYETFQFFSTFQKKFSAQIAEYDDMKASNPSMSQNELRQKYLDDNNYAQDSLARMCNPFWKFDPDLER